MGFVIFRDFLKICVIFNTWIIIYYYYYFDSCVVTPSGGRFAHCKIIQAYCLLLRHYGTNSTLTNHCIVKILHRVAFDCKMPAMLFQASLFVTFQKILNDPRMKIDSAIKVNYKKFLWWTLTSWLPQVSRNLLIYIDTFLCLFTFKSWELFYYRVSDLKLRLFLFVETSLEIET